jgi:hypothetical protein
MRKRNTDSKTSSNLVTSWVQLLSPATSISEYLHQKAEESRHNETVGYLIVVIGSAFFVGGLLLEARAKKDLDARDPLVTLCSD